jgi:hypothetical protein
VARKSEWRVPTATQSGPVPPNDTLLGVPAALVDDADLRSTRRLDEDAAAAILAAEGQQLSIWGRFKAGLKRHGRKLWWFHSLYALGLGAFVVVFAQKGFAYVRWLTLVMVVAWIVTLAVFRRYGSGRTQRIDTRPERVRFHLMTYVLKNLYQGMLFFLLPFYFKASVGDGPTRWFAWGLALFTILATLDVVFDKILMRWRLLGSVYYLVALFACLNLAIPALFPLPTALALVLAAAAAVPAFCSLNYPWARLKQPRMLAGIGVATVVGASLVWMARGAIPPVPLAVATGAVGTTALPDGRLGLEITRAHASLVNHLHGSTDVLVPAGLHDGLVHVWRQGEVEVLRINPDLQRVDPGQIRLRSKLDGEQLPPSRSGRWTLDVETGSGQLVGRVRFEVVD